MLILPAVILAGGTVGYPAIEGKPWTFFDGFYMTAITLTTIGYGETYPLSTAGRAFTVVLAFGGIFVLGYFGTELVRTVVSGELRDMLGKERMEEALSDLKDHVIVCGLGRMGIIVCQELEAQRRRFVAIEKQILPYADWSYEYGIRLPGDATSDDVLRKAGIDRAKAMITVISSDADNLYVCLSARLLNPKLAIIARAEEEDAALKLRKVGATQVISPYLAGGQRAVHSVYRPNVLKVMESATRPEVGDLLVEEIVVRPQSSLVGLTLKESKLATEHGILIAGMQKPGGEFLYAPQGQHVIEAGAVLIAFGSTKELRFLESVSAAEESI